MFVGILFMLGIIAVTACEGCVDWNRTSTIEYIVYVSSQPARAVWIEIAGRMMRPTDCCVTACEGCVDWNFAQSKILLYRYRHSLRGLCGLKYNHRGHLICRGDVTACEGCVDWNDIWIDMVSTVDSVTACEGCVDWNWHTSVMVQKLGTSQPARAVWIEILHLRPVIRFRQVTACEGCVDWNPCIPDTDPPGTGHSLRGLCGLKFS